MKYKEIIKYNLSFVIFWSEQLLTFPLISIQKYFDDILSQLFLFLNHSLFFLSFLYFPFLPKAQQEIVTIYLSSKFILQQMELYHQTLLKPIQSLQALALHLFPIKPKEDHEKSRQLLLAKTSSIELFHYMPVKIGQQKYQLKQFYREQLFSNICAVEALEYLDEEMKKDLIILTLSNGKYQLLEWMPQSTRCSLRDQGYAFGNQEEVESGLCKPVSGQYISVNNEAKMVMIASINWEFKLFSQTIGFTGVRLTPLLYFQQPISTTSICVQLAAGYGDSLFYSLRYGLDGNKKVAKVCRLYKKESSFQEEIIPINDSSAHMLIVRGQSFAALGQSTATYYTKGKSNVVKIPQIKESLFSCVFHRTGRDKKQDYFVINENGFLFAVLFDDNKPNGCVVNLVEKIFSTNHIIALEKNLFFALSATQDNYIFTFTNGYRVQDKGKNQRSKEDLTREELLNPKYQTFKEIQILSSFQSSRMIRDMKLANIQKTACSQIILTGGRPGNKKGFLSILKYGLKVKEILAVNFVPPIGAWCIKKSINDKHHSYIVFSFASRKTASYSFENLMLSHTNELKLEEYQTTLHVNKMYDGSIVQVTASKIRHINKDNQNRDLSIKGRIMKAICVSEGRQLLILLIGGFMEYYELNSNGQLKLMNEFNLDSEANFIDYAPPEIVDNRPVSKLIAIGKTNYNISLFVLQGKGLELVNTKNIKCMIQSLTFLSLQNNNYQIIVGTNSGKMVKLVVTKGGEVLSTDESDICEKSVRYSKITVMNKLNLLRTCPEPTLSYKWQGQEQQCTLPLPSVDFISEIVIEGSEKNCIFITYYENYLRFIQISGFGNLLQQFDKDIELPGKKIVICGDRLGILSQSKERKEEKEAWKAVFCLFNSSKNYSLEKILQFQQNQKCMCVCYVPRDELKGYLCFGCVTDYQTYPSLRAQKPCIKVFSFEKDKDPLLNFFYQFSVEDIPTAMEVFLDKLLVGVGKKIHLYDIYPSKLLLKASRSGLASYINSIVVQGEKIITSEVFNSFTVYRHNPIEKTFDYIGQDLLPRFLSTSYLLDGDYGVIAGGDKFGNFFISKFSEKIKNEFETGGQSKYNEYTDCNKLDSLVSYNMGEILTSIQSGHLNERRPQSIFYSTIDGRVGMFYPFESEETKELLLLQKLQDQLRATSLPCASNHQRFRSYYSPAKGVTDGDFCKLFQILPEGDRNKIASNLHVDVRDISILLATIQNKFK